MNVLDTFAGIGGFSLGMERAGFNTVAFVEIDPYCQQVLRKHWPTVKQYGDICNVTAERLRSDGIVADVVTGGFPCQDVSVGHTWREAQGLDGKRSGLWAHLCRLVDEIRPQWFVAENVAALRTRGLARCLQDLWQIGYDAEWHIIAAAHAGADHTRERIWIIAYPAGQRVEGLWPVGFEIARPLAQPLLSIRNSHGQWKTEPDVCRIADGVPKRVDRLRCVGNAVVPAVPELIGRAIMAAECST